MRETCKANRRAIATCAHLVGTGQLQVMEDWHIEVGRGWDDEAV